MAKVQTKDVVGLDQTLGQKLDTDTILESDGIIKVDKVPETYTTDALIDTGTTDPNSGLPFYQLNPNAPIIASKVTATDILDPQGNLKSSIIPETFTTDVLLDTGTIDPVSGLPFYTLNSNQTTIASILQRLSQLEAKVGP